MQRPKAATVFSNLSIVFAVLGFFGALGFGASSSASEVTATNAVSTNAAAMSPELFRKIAASPGDKVPLISQLARIPIWTNATASNEMKYASGKVFQEEMSIKARTVAGKYVVFDAYSNFYHQQMSCILAYDEKAGTLKTYGLYSDGQGNDVLTEGVVRYNYADNTYTITSQYGDDFKETTDGTYTDKEEVAKTIVYKNGELFMTRVVKTHPLVEKESGMAR